MIADGVVVEACKACADMYGASYEVSALGIDVKYMETSFMQYTEGWLGHTDVLDQLA